MRQACVRLLTAVPILALIAALPFVNRIYPLVLGLPFLLFWMLAWVMVTPVLLGLAYVITRAGGDAPTRSSTAGEAERVPRADGGGR